MTNWRNHIDTSNSLLLSRILSNVKHPKSLKSKYVLYSESICFFLATRHGLHGGTKVSHVQPSRDFTDWTDPDSSVRNGWRIPFSLLHWESISNTQNEPPSRTGHHPFSVSCTIHWFFLLSSIFWEVYIQSIVIVIPDWFSGPRRMSRSRPFGSKALTILSSRNISLTRSRPLFWLRRGQGCQKPSSSSTNPWV